MAAIGQEFSRQLQPLLYFCRPVHAHHVLENRTGCPAAFPFLLFPDFTAR
jgi:hypothetical protein